MNKSKKIISFIAAFIAALIMLQTLYFKFTAAPESVYIFTTLGMEPYGRIGIGTGELIASILILIPLTNWFGALIGIGLMSGAVFFHISKLGIAVDNDGGQLFIYALIVLICSIVVALINIKKIPVINKYVK